VRTCPACGEPNAPGARFCQACGQPLPAETPARELRKTVTVLFADVAGSTALGERLDAESLRRIMSRYFEAMSGIVDHHGGTVEKFIGDAVMAVFGVPMVHEDDALRAVRAAMDMRAELERLNQELRSTQQVALEVRTGINTGVVIVGSPVAGHGFVTGDAVNVAARLEQMAEPGEILLGETTFKLVREVVSVEPRGPIHLRGKAEKVTGYRLLDVSDLEPRVARGMRSPLVGRAGELTLVDEAFRLAISDRACYLLTVLGTAGVGKSRLIEEAIDRLEERPVVLTGRCLSYGEGITFWPIRELVRAACDIPADADPETLRRAIASRMEGEEHSDRVAQGVAHLMGLPGATGNPEETSWAVRRFLEITARGRPLIVIIDDIHWADPGLLDLIEYLADFTQGSVLFLCIARLELLDVRPAWGAGRRNAMTITLSPLTTEDSRSLVDNLLSGGQLEDQVLAHVVEASEGNPFFLEEMVRMLLDEDALHLEGGRWVVARDLRAVGLPATISALLAARLERLDEAERVVAERASVVGKVFYWGAVAALTPEEERADVGRHLSALVRRDLVTPEVSSFMGEDAFRFRHILICDAAYEAVPKEQRTELHERLARWTEEKVGDRVAEFEEIIGFHLERAYRLRRELGRSDEKTAELAHRAFHRLAGAGQRALDRGDAPAAVALLSRAVALLDRGDPDRARLIPDLAQALEDHGDLGPAAEVLEEVVASGPPEVGAHAQLMQLWLRLYTEPEGATGEISRSIEHLVPILQTHRDERGMARADLLRVELDWMAARYRAVEERLESVAAHAASIGDRRQEMTALGRIASAVLYGPRPVHDALRRCEEIRARASGDRRVEASLLQTEAQLTAMAGRFEGVRETIDRAVAILEDLGLTLLAPSGQEVRSAVEMLAGDFPAAEAALRRAFEALEEMGERGWLSTTGAELARAIYAQGRHEEADEYAARAEDLGASDDVATLVTARGVRAKAAARRGDLDLGMKLAEEMIAAARPTEFPDLRGDAYADLAEVLGLAGRADEAERNLDAAVAQYEAKGNVVSAARARAARARSVNADRS
jgi:class 3 adenylate cyclase/tetratricopeptide (TPR) repeat protein